MLSILLGRIIEINKPDILVFFIIFVIRCFTIGFFIFWDRVFRLFIGMMIFVGDLKFRGVGSVVTGVRKLIFNLDWLVRSKDYVSLFDLVGDVLGLHGGSFVGHGVE